MLLTHEARLETNQLSASKGAKLNYITSVAQTGPNNKIRNQFNNNWNKNAGNNTRGKGGYGRGYAQGQGRGNWNGMQLRNYQGRWGCGTGNEGFIAGNGNFARIGGFNNGKNVFDPNNTIAVFCQICFKPKHTTVESRNRFNKDFISFYNPAQFLAPKASYPNFALRAVFLTTSEGEIIDQCWYIDSRAIHHLTNNLQNLNLGKEYWGNQILRVRNGQGLYISHIGYTCLPTSCDSSLHLHDILYVP